MDRATCGSCGKSYRVSDPDRAYRCKACGGAVRVAVPVGAEGAPEREGVDCPACAAENRPDARLCKACGASLAPEAETSPTDGLERSLASREMTRTLGTLRTLRLLYAIYAAIEALAVGFWILVLARGLGPGLDGEPAIRALVITEAVVAAGACAVFVVGAFRVIGRPLVWSIVLAAVTTLQAAQWLGIFGPGVVSLGAVALAALQWCAVAPASRVRALMRKYPDLRVTRELRGERANLDRAKALAKINPRRVAAARRSGRRRLLVLGTALAAVALVAGALWMVSKWTTPKPTSATAAPAAIPAFEPVAAKFMDAWNGSRYDELPSFFESLFRERRSRELKRVFARRGWDVRLPAIGRPSVSAPPAKRFRTLFPLPNEKAGTALTTIWEVHDGRWFLDTLKFPDEDE